VSEFQGVGEEEMGREPEGVLIQTVELSALKQEASVEPLVPKEEEPGSGEDGEKEKASFRQLPGLIEFPDPRQVVDDIILRPNDGGRSWGLCGDRL
jgi:hypothetical protein